MRLFPTTSTYTLNIGQILGPVTCSADCSPYCTFQWTKESSAVATGATLSLSVDNRNRRGTYTCEATRGGSFTDRRSISLFVRCMYFCSFQSHLVVAFTLGSNEPGIIIDETKILTQWTCSYFLYS